jgi:hypothetical protein
VSADHTASSHSQDPSDPSAMSFESFALLNSSPVKEEGYAVVEDKPSHRQTSSNVAGSQIKAILLKNTSLEFRKKRLNIGTCCCIVAMNAILAALALILLGSEFRLAMENCSKTYISDDYRSLTCG